MSSNFSNAFYLLTVLFDDNKFKNLLKNLINTNKIPLTLDNQLDFKSALPVDLVIYGVKQKLVTPKKKHTVYGYFLNLSKAFDRISNHLLWVTEKLYLMSRSLF